MYDFSELKKKVEQQAKVHDQNREQGIDCCGLPDCVSCRSVVLIQCEFDTEKTQAFIDSQEEGTVVTLKD